VRLNHLDSLLSLKLARASGAHIDLVNSHPGQKEIGKMVYGGRVVIQPEELGSFVRIWSLMNVMIEELFSAGRYLKVQHEELCSDTDGVCRRIQKFLGITNHLLIPDTSRQRIGGQCQWISNYDELRNHFSARPEGGFFQDP
jgi:hypothetical protein